jgi:UDP-glucose-4-epimerase GalE
MRVLVTGGAGYIGSQTVRLLRRRGHEPVVLDTLEHGHPAAVEDAPIVVGSVADRPVVRELLGRHDIEAVIHFAALKAAGESVDQPARYFEANVGATIDLLAEVEAAGIGSVVYSSSAAVYGNPPSSPVVEDAPTRPTNPYGESKLLVERMLPWLERRGVRHVSLRYFNAAGAEPDGAHGEHPLVVEAAFTGRPLTVLGTDYPTPDGTAVRDYVHVADLAEAHVRALDHLASGGGSLTLNLGTGRGSSVREVVAAVGAAAGRTVPTVDADRRAGDPAAVWADPARAATSLGWVAQLGLDEIARSAVRWRESHPVGYVEDRVLVEKPA